MNDNTNKKDSEVTLNKFLFWKKKERKKPETFVEKIIEFFRQLFWAAIAAFFIITFIVEHSYSYRFNAGHNTSWGFRSRK